MYRELKTPMWELDDFFGLEHTGPEYIEWEDTDLGSIIPTGTHIRDDEWKNNIRLSITDWWNDTNGGGRRRQYREDGRVRVRPEDKETPLEKSESRSKGMTLHWNSEEGERQKELYRDRNRKRIQKIVDDLNHTPKIGPRSVVFYGKVFSSIRECNRLTGVDRTYIKRHSSPVNK